jgi:ABC-type nitrate/sulfonate/bicarbonate transport system substrate-binding protein
MSLKIMASRHSAFYSPLLATIARGFDATYSVLGAGQRSQDLIREGVVDVMQSAPSSNWKPTDRGEGPLPVHFALINRRDGFVIAAPEADDTFLLKKLEGRRFQADRGEQPMAMLRYALAHNGVDWDRIQVVEDGDADYIHRQAPGAWLPVGSVGASMPEVAFSTLCCSREFVGTPEYEEFLAAYKEARRWVQAAAPEDVATAEARFFLGVNHNDLADAIEAYQKLGTWTGGVEIDEGLYQQALTVFGRTGAARHPRASVCV